MASKSSSSVPDGHVSLTLSNPLAAESFQTMGVEHDAVAAGGTAVVPENIARAIINAGYAAVDPADQVAVAALLGTTPPVEAAPALSPTGGTTSTSTSAS